MKKIQPYLKRVILPLGLAVSVFVVVFSQPRLGRSTLTDTVRRKVAQHPNWSAAEITAYANQLLQQRGFNYEFDICDYLVSRKITPLSRNTLDDSPIKDYRLTFSLQGQATKTFRVKVDDGGPCGECFADIPATLVTARTLHAVVKGATYPLQRPANFRLDEIALVDETMRKVMRKWESPSQSSPLGISPDGQTIYLPVEFSDADLEAVRRLLEGENKLRKPYPSSLLAISPSGLRFEVAAPILRRQQMETLNPPLGLAKDGYEVFKRFRIGKQTYILRYSAPCT